MAALRPTDLRCERQVNPLGIDAARPALSWICEAVDPNTRGQRQTAYQVLVAGSEPELRRDHGDLWDSGRVDSGGCLQVLYDGKPLHAGQPVWWKVRIWDRDGQPSPYSEPATWEMGLLNDADWGARWIARDAAPPADPERLFDDDPCPLLRKEFTLEKPVARARAYVSGLGDYELRLNGQKVGDHLLDPGWTDYRKRVFYNTFDVTPLLRTGANAVGFMLGNGFWNPLPLPMFFRFNYREWLAVGPPRAILRLEVEFTDGTRTTIVTDESWKAGDGPILRNSVYLGEQYDARREQPGWDLPGFDDRSWRAVVLPTEKLGPLKAQEMPPVRLDRTLRPVAITEPHPGVFIFDLGENFAGTVTLRAQGPAGTKIVLRYGELLHPDGSLNVMTSVAGQLKNQPVPSGSKRPSTAWQSDSYVLKGEGLESYAPRFTFHGFRYVEVSGFPGRPSLDALEGRFLHAVVESAGEFSCANGLFNRVQQVVRHTLLCNLYSVQSDCPHREKLGYGGDIVATSDMAILNFDMARFYRKTAHDFADEVRPNGGFTEISPFVGIDDEGLGEGAGPVGWGTAHPLLVWQAWQYYGDRRLVEEQYPAALRWLRLLRSKAVDGILDNGISDHESLVPKPRAVTGTSFLYWNARLIERMARLLGREDEAAECDCLARQTREAFNRRFLDPATGRYDSGIQCCQAAALFFDLVPPQERETALRALTGDVLETHHGHLTTGIFGTKYLLTALTELGRADVAYTLADQRDFPGWAHMLESGATTLWEHWEYEDSAYSHNHPMFGSVSEWFFRALAGIDPDADAHGFDRVRIRPRPVGGLDWAKGGYRSARGPVASEWRRDGAGFHLEVTVPVGTTAEVRVPAAHPDAVTESGRPAAQSEGVRFLRTEDGAAVFETGSGTYRFHSTLG